MAVPEQLVSLIRSKLLTFDVAVSFAHHQGKDVESVIQAMEDPDCTLSGRTNVPRSTFPTKVLSWEGHVRSWLDGASVPVHCVRYEDMKARPLETFTEIVRFSGLEYDRAEIDAALAACAFGRLQELERKTGFREKLPEAVSFFRKGAVGSWREALTQSQVDRVISVHGAVMRRLGYLDASDNPLY